MEGINIYSRIGAKSFFKRNGFAENIVVSHDGVASNEPVKLRISFFGRNFDVHQLYDFFQKGCELSEFVEIDGTLAKIEYNLFEIIGYVLSGDFERDCLKEGLDLAKIGKMPYLDVLEQKLVGIIAKLYNQNGFPLLRKHFPFSICLTHDVDEVRKTYQYFTRTLRFAKSGEVSRSFKELQNFFIDKIKGENPFWTFEKLMEVENSYKVRSTFFFLEESAKVTANPVSWKHYGRRYKFDDENVTEIIKELDKNGWEVALHGSYNSFNDLNLLEMEKSKLEKALGKKVFGIRQHNLNFSIPYTWEIQRKAGFLYDTSLGFKSSDGIGFRWGTSKPFKPFTEQGEEIDILEIPLTLMDISLKSPEEGREAVEKLISSVKDFGEVFCVLWHHAFFNPRDFGEWIELYSYILELGKTKGAEFLTASEINDIWRKREESPLKVVYGKNKVAYSCDYPFVRMDVV